MPRKAKTPRPLNAFGKFLATFRIQNDLTMEDWIKKTGWSQVIIGNMERDKSALTVERAIVIANIIREYKQEDVLKHYITLLVNELRVIPIDILTEEQLQRVSDAVFN